MNKYWTFASLFCFCLCFVNVSSLKSYDGFFQAGKGMENGSFCSLDMFGGDNNAYLACVTEYALQQNWFPSPIAGLETYLNWNGFDGFWQNGVFLETMANFMHYGNNTRYISVLNLAWRSLDDLLHAYYPQPSFDDEAWFGLAFARIYEVTGNTTFLDVAFDIYNWTWTTGWDHNGACSGGFWFDGRFSAKITITNAQMLQLGAKLNRLDPKRDPDMPRKINMTLNYILGNKVLDPQTLLVSDSIDITTCKANNRYNLTYNSGVLFGGFVQLYQLSHDFDHLDTAHRIAVTNIKNLSRDGVLTEYCDPDESCYADRDAQIFKGIFVKNLRYLMDLSNSSMVTWYRSWLQHNIDSVIKSAICKKKPAECDLIMYDGPSYHSPVGPVFSNNWKGPYQNGSPIEQTPAMDLFTAAILPQTRCQGPGCRYDPPIPKIVHIDCKHHPCPKGETCCTREVYFHTCCTVGQECIDGGCY